MPDLDYEVVYRYFLDREFDVEPVEHLGQAAVSVCFEVAGQVITLLHFHVAELRALPQFYLKDHKAYGALAHVLPSSIYDGLGSVCVNELDSVSVNFERPELVFEESIKRHIELISKVVTDPDFNRQELLREFHSNWFHATKKIRRNGVKSLYMSSSGTAFEFLDIYRPVRNDSFRSIPASCIALPASREGQEIADFFQVGMRRKHEQAVCAVIPLLEVPEFFPDSNTALKQWFISALKMTGDDTGQAIEKVLLGQRSKEFHIVFNICTPSGIAWIGTKLSRDKKKSFPNTNDKFSGWRVEPLSVEVFNKERLMPRSGANCSLTNKRVLLVGGGSVGSELADKLGAAGIGNIDITDSDYFSVSNTYRHTLDQDYTSYPKSIALVWKLVQKYPWIRSKGFNSRLLDIRDDAIISQYDLIIVAIGAPTHERLFHEYICQSKKSVPVIYSWLEGYGIGGHAVLDIPGKKGCLRCAYVDTESGRRGLGSNLNFLKSDQNIVKNYAGCGEMFLPYGAVSSAQTALVAADLAISYLEGKLEASTKVSWKGSRFDVDSEGLALTRRYDSFNASLKKQPLSHPLCDVCSSDDVTRFQYQGTQLCVPTSVLEQLSEFKQSSPNQTEAAGLLIGYIKINGEVGIDRITTPKAKDIRQRAYFKLDSKPHQKDVEEAFECTDGLLGYLGTWHTHPQNVPTPSGMDIVDWKTHDGENSERQLFFIVVGLEKTAVYTVVNGKTVELLPFKEGVK